MSPFVPQTTKGIARRKKILDTACRLFAEKGFDTVTTRELAAESGCSEALLFRYFSTKEKIYNVLFDEYCENLKAPFVMPAQENETGRQWLERVLDTFGSYKDSLARPGLRLAVINRYNKRNEFDDAIKNSSDIVTDLLIPIFERGNADGSIPVLNVPQAAITFWLFASAKILLLPKYYVANPKYHLPTTDEILKAVSVIP